MKINIKRMSPNAILPTLGHPSDAGIDLYACDIPNGEIEIAPHDIVKIGTGVAIEIPEGYAGLILPRSGITFKRGLRPGNAPALMDPGYTGEWICAMRNDSNEWQKIKNGERIAQMLVVPVMAIEFTEVDDLKTTERNTGGFGSTGI